MRNKTLQKLLMILTVLALVFRAGLPASATNLPGDFNIVQLPEGNTLPENSNPAEEEPGNSDSPPSGEVPGEAPPEEEMLPPPESSESEFPAENSTEAPADDNLLPTETDGESSESEEELTEANQETVESEMESGGEALAFGRILNETTIEVYTYDELKQALSGDNGYTTIYLGDNITADGTGIDIHPNKTDVIIDGAPPEGGRYRFTQYASANDSTSIRVRSAGIQSVTLRNLDIHGANYYGVVWVPDSISGIAIIHENVDYTGPQPVYNRSGTTRLADSTYTLRPVSGMSGEIAETMHAEFSGTIHISAAGTNHPVLQLTSSVSTLTVLDGTEVTVNTDYGFLGTNGQTPDVTLCSGSAFHLTSSRYGFTVGDYRVRRFLVESDAALNIYQDTRESLAALRISSLFQMEPGSSATIVRTGTDGIPLRMTNSNAQVIWNQPERVFLYSSAGVPLRFTGAGTLSIRTSALNLWQSTGWPVSGGTDDLPDHIWNKSDGETLVMTAAYDTTIKSLTSNLTGDDPVVSALDTQNFNLEKNQLVALGSMTLDIDTPDSQSLAISGHTSYGAALTAAYTLNDGTDGTTDGIAGAYGQYLLPVTGGTLKADSVVTITASANGIAMRKTAVVQDSGQFRLSFVSVPEQLQFGSIPVPEIQTLANPQGDEFALTVGDTRPKPTGWRIDASLTQPLTAQVDGLPRRIDNAVVFRKAGSAPFPLNEAPMTIYHQTGGTPGEHTVQWSDGEGILLNLFPGEIYSGVNYTTTIHWELVDAP